MAMGDNMLKITGAFPSVDDGWMNGYECLKVNLKRKCSMLHNRLWDRVRNLTYSHAVVCGMGKKSLAREVLRVVDVSGMYEAS